MNTLFLTIICFTGYIIAYVTYGRFIANKIFRISVKNKMPSHTRNDGIDYVPTKRHILFGHHFTTIAGLGPIVGPAIGVIWGWLPALLWVFFGSIFMGAVHDFSSLIVSSRHDGKTIGDLTGDLISPSTRYAFQFIMQFLLFIVLSVFAMIVGVLFELYPEAVFPVWMQVPIAVWLGSSIKKGKNEFLFSVIAVILMYVTIIIGTKIPITVPPIRGSAVVTWCIILFIYVYFASTIPVQKLLQPRDYINSHQLFIAIFMLILGIFIAHPVITAPAINEAALAPETDIPKLAPLLFITIACGAISGFHSLASSGTTVKQLNNENDALFIGYGGMLWESFLAVIVIMAVAGGLGLGVEDKGIFYTGSEAYYHHYSSWASASGLGAKLDAFITGSANLFASYGIPPLFGKSMIAVFIVSFANTTLDSSARIQRLSLQEICLKKDGSISKPFDNRYVSTFFVILAAAIMTFIKPGAKGALILWPLFGSMNQLLAALALGLITIYLYLNKKNFYITLLPMFFVLLITLWAMFQNIIRFIDNNEHLLTLFSVIILILTGWLLTSGVISLIRNQNKKP